MKRLKKMFYKVKMDYDNSGSLVDLPLRVLIPWTLGIFLLIVTGLWMACDMMNEGKEPLPRIYFEERR